MADLGRERGKAADDAMEARACFGLPFIAARGRADGGVVDLVVGCRRPFFGLHPEWREESVAVAAAPHVVQPEAAEEGNEGEAADDAAD